MLDSGQDAGVTALGLATDLILGLTGTAIAALIGTAWLFVQRWRARRLWPFGGERFAVVLATSTSTHTGTYTRTASGIGQVRSLAVLVPSIYRAWRGKLDVSNVLLSDDITDEWTRDLIVVGGVKNNKVTREMLSKYRDRHADRGWPDVQQVGSAISWNGTEYTAVTDSDVVYRDYGMVLRWANPFHEGCSVILFAGASTYGTIAASLWYAGQRQPSSQHESKHLLRKNHFIALVEADVRDGHVALPRLLAGEPLE